MFWENILPDATLSEDLSLKLNQTNETIANIVDGRLAYKSGDVYYGKWLTNNPAETYGLFTFSSPVVVSGYSLFSGNDSTGRQPTAWTLSGSNDGTNWVTLDTRTGVATRAFHTSLGMFSVDNSAAYNYYRWDVDAVGEGSMMQITEMQLYAPVKASDLMSHANFSGTATTNYQTNTTTEPVSMLLDNDSNTKYCTRYTVDENNDPVGGIEVVITLGKASSIFGYTLTSANDAMNRAPRTWTLYGSTDGADWTELDSQINVAFLEYYQTQAFTFADSSAGQTAYSQYKFVFVDDNQGWWVKGPGDSAVSTELASENTESLFQIAGIGLLTDQLTAGADSYALRNAKITSASTTNTGMWGDGAVEHSFDGSSLTKWGLNEATPSLTLTLDEASVVTAYTLSAVNEVGGNLARNPLSWEFYGVDDTGTPTLLDSQTNIQFYEGTDYNSLKNQVFTFANDTAYASYYLDITANNGHANQFQLAEIGLFTSGAQIGDDPYRVNFMQQDEPVGVSTTFTGTFATNRGFSNLFDDDLMTGMSAETNISSDNPFEIVVDVPTDWIASGYTIAVSPASVTDSPTTWDVMGWDGDEWITLDSVEDFIMGSEAGTEYFFTFDADEFYDLYKFSFYETYNPGATAFQLGELAMWGRVPEPSTWAMMLLGMGAFLFETKRRKVLARRYNTSR
ncbi:MAG: discoidin domain-containing protein [Planctomycetia bacterium]|nr:discoidin domain-containing protein [Planctomycetia bacterium]